MLAIEKHFSKFARVCGFKVEGERGFDPMAETMEALEQDTKGAKPLSSSLLYKFAEDSSGVVFSEGCKASTLVTLTSPTITTKGVFVSRNASSILSTSATWIGLGSS